MKYHTRRRMCGVFFFTVGARSQRVGVRVATRACVERCVPDSALRSAGERVDFQGRGARSVDVIWWGKQSDNGVFVDVV